MITYIILAVLFIWMIILTTMWANPRSELENTRQELLKMDIYRESNKARECSNSISANDTTNSEYVHLYNYVKNKIYETACLGAFEIFVDEKVVFNRKTNHTAFVRVQNDLTEAGYEVTYDHNLGIMHIYWGNVSKNSKGSVEFKVTPGLKKVAEEIKTEMDPLLATMDKFCMSEPNSDRVYKVFFGGKIGYMCYENLIKFKEEIAQINPSYHVISELINKEPKAAWLDPETYLKENNKCK